MTHIGGLFVVVNVVHVSGQTKVSDFHHIILRYQNVPGRQVSMDTLRTQRGEVITTNHASATNIIQLTWEKCI